MPVCQFQHFRKQILFYPIFRHLSILIFKITVNKINSYFLRMVILSKHSLADSSDTAFPISNPVSEPVTLIT